MLTENPVPNTFLAVQSSIFDEGPSCQVVQVLKTEQAGFQARSLYNMKNIGPQDDGLISYTWVLSGCGHPDVRVQLATRSEVEAALRSTISKRATLVQDLKRQIATAHQEWDEAQRLLEHLLNGSDLLHYAPDTVVQDATPPALEVA